MATIFDLTPRQLLRLQTLDPLLDTDYQEVLASIFEVLDSESRSVLLRYHLNPKSIFYHESNNEFYFSPPLSLQSTANTTKIVHDQLIDIVEKMGVFLAKLKPTNDNDSVVVDARQFAKELEGLLSLLEKYKSEVEESDYREIQRAFLYELIGDIDHLQFEVPQNRRGITSNITKIFLKEVFIKHAIQGINFAVWDTNDLETIGTDDIPDELKIEITNRKLAVIDTEYCWFLVAPVSDFRANRYSISRFLEEDMEYGLYLTYGLCIPKHQINHDKKMLRVVLKLLTTIYTLEISVSKVVTVFIDEIKRAQKEQLEPLLREKFDINGDSASYIVRQRLTDYEKKISSLILSRIPVVITSANSRDDFFVFNHYLEKILNDLWRELEIFNLLPIVVFNDDARLLSNRLLSYRLLLKKTQHFLWDNNRDWQQRLAILRKPYETLKSITTETLIRSEELDEMIEYAEYYEERQAEKRRLPRIRFGRPKHESDELLIFKRTLIDDTYGKIVMLGKSHRETLVYFELESPLSYLHDDDYRHYAVCHSKNAIDKLPLIVQLPKDRKAFDADELYELVQSVCPEQFIEH